MDHAASAPGLETAFLAQVGERVRNARATRGLSRKALSQISGVSHRYLAQLEGGDGNISILLLKRVAGALEFSVESLLGEAVAGDAETRTAMALFRQAAPGQRRKVMEILQVAEPVRASAGRIALIGLRGAGKSTLGRRCAEGFGVRFVELNHEIEQTSGMPVNEVMALYGQEGYRRLERQAVERIAGTPGAMVLAVGGGIVSEPETFAFLLRNYHTIWLRAKPEEHMQRVRNQGDTRPMAGNPTAMQELRNILTSREQLYAQAEAQVDTSGKTLAQSVADLLALVEDRRFLRG